MLGSRGHGLGATGEDTGDSASLRGPVDPSRPRSARAAPAEGDIMSRHTVEAVAYELARARAVVFVRGTAR